MNIFVVLKFEYNILFMKTKKKEVIGNEIHWLAYSSARGAWFTLIYVCKHKCRKFDGQSLQSSLNMAPYEVSPTNKLSQSFSSPQRIP